MKGVEREREEWEKRRWKRIREGESRKGREKVKGQGERRAGLSL